MKLFLAVTVAAVLSAVSFAQSLPPAQTSTETATVAWPAAPSAAIGTNATPAAEPSAVTPALPVTPAPMAYSRVEAHPKVVDRNFALLYGAAAAALVFDVEATMSCLNSGRCRETNPLFGHNPTRAKLYAINAPLLGGEMVLSRWMKKRAPNQKTWMIAPIAMIGVHGLGGGLAISHR